MWVIKIKKENHSRSFLKSVTWRVLATLTTMALVLLFTGNAAIAISIGALESVAKLLIYYIHERVWINVKWGVAD